jgi:hypothetical protein
MPWTAWTMPSDALDGPDDALDGLDALDDFRCFLPQGEPNKCS